MQGRITHREEVHTHLLADVLPLAVELVQQLLDVDGERRLGLLLEVDAHLVDAVDAGLDGVDVIHQRLARGERRAEVTLVKFS